MFDYLKELNSNCKDDKIIIMKADGARHKYKFPSSQETKEKILKEFFKIVNAWYYDLAMMSKVIYSMLDKYCDKQND